METIIRSYICTVLRNYFDLYYTITLRKYEKYYAYHRSKETTDIGSIGLKGLGFRV